MFYVLFTTILPFAVGLYVCNMLENSLSFPLAFAAFALSRAAGLILFTSLPNKQKDNKSLGNMAKNEKHSLDKAQFLVPIFAVLVAFVLVINGWLSTPYGYTVAVIISLAGTHLINKRFNLHL